MRDDELTELLSLARRDYEPPEGFREELLASLRVDVAGSSASPAESPMLDYDSLSDEPNGESTDDVLVVDHDVVRSLEIERGGRPGRLIALAAAAAAAILIVTVSVGSNREFIESGPVGDVPDTPIQADESNEASGLAAASNSEVCSELGELTLESGFLGNERTELTSEQLGRLSELLVELDDRGLLDADPSEAVVALSYAKLTAEQGASDASAARDRARSLVSGLRLDRAGCPPTSTDG